MRARACRRVCRRVRLCVRVRSCTGVYAVWRCVPLCAAVLWWCAGGGGVYAVCWSLLALGVLCCRLPFFFFLPFSLGGGVLCCGGVLAAGCMPIFVHIVLCIVLCIGIHIVLLSFSFRLSYVSLIY